MKGIMGQFISVIPMTVIAMLVVSLVEALVILPVHADEIMKTRKEKKSIFSRVEGHYRRYLNWTINHKWIMLVIMIGIFAVSIMQGGRLFQKFTLFPATGLTGISIRLEVERNTPIAKTAELANILSQRLDKISGGDFESVYANVGQVTTGGAGGSRQNGSHLAGISIIFTSDPDFIQREKPLLAKIREVTAAFGKEYNTQTSVTISRPGPPVGKPIQYQITSRDTESSRQILERLRGIFAEIPGVNSLESDADGDTRKYRFLIDNSFAISEGVDPASISRTIFAASTGVVTNEITKNNEKVEILVGLAGQDNFSIKELLALKVRNRGGQAVPISAFVKSIEESGPSSIQRLNRVRTITMFGEVDEKVISGSRPMPKLSPKLKS